MGFKNIFGKKHENPNIKIVKKGERVKNTSLMLKVFFFEDSKHSRPKLISEKDHEEFIWPIMADIIKLHYYGVFKPPKKWTYDFRLVTIPENSLPKGLDFRDHDTNEIKNRGAYSEFCGMVPQHWIDELISRFPEYDKSKLSIGFQNIKFDYFPLSSLLVASLLLDDILEYGIKKIHHVK